MKTTVIILTVFMLISTSFAADKPANGGVVKPANGGVVKPANGGVVKPANGGVHIPGAVVKNIEYNSDLDLYEVAAADGQLFYLTKDRKHVIFGNVFEIPTMKNLTEEKKSIIFKVDFSKLPLDKAIKISDGQKRIAVFTSPDCPWCRKLHQELKKLSGVSVYAFLVPYGSPDKLKSVVCAGNKAEAFEKAYAGETLPSVGNCNYQHVADNGNLTRSLSINAYPTVITEDGKRISGYVALDKLKDAIFQKPAVSSAKNNTRGVN